jgi:hypothetical protein
MCHLKIHSEKIGKYGMVSKINLKKLETNRNHHGIKRCQWLIKQQIKFQQIISETLLSIADLISQLK